MTQPVNALSIPSHSHKKRPIEIKQLKIKVSLHRQSKIENEGEKHFSNALIGEGEVWELPPRFSDSLSITHLDWEGEANINSDVMVGGFIAGNVSVRAGHPQLRTLPKLILA